MTNFAPAVSDAQAIVEAATRAAGPQALHYSTRFHVVVSPDGEVKVIDLEAEQDEFEHRHKPRRKSGTYKVHDAESFVAYLAKHADSESEVWADTIAAKITGVLNAHPNTLDGDAARHEDHQVVYSVLLTTAWKAWTAYDGQFLDQSTFAEHIEDRSADIRRPDAADMLELAQTFQATTSVVFESSKRLSDGQRQFEYREHTDAKAGRLEIPETFDLGLRPFEGADAFKVVARLRYRIHDGTLAIGYKLERPDDVLREAFLSVVAKVQAGVTDLDLLNSPIFLGSR